MRPLPLALVVLALNGCVVPTPTPARPPPSAPTVAPALPSTPTPPSISAPATEPVATLPQPAIGDAGVDSPEWPALGFLRGWQTRDFGAMAVATGSVGEAKAAQAAILANQYDFRPLRGAEILAVEQRGPTLARITARVWYEFPAGRVQRKRVGLMIERTDEARTAATGPSPWRVNAASAAAESDDP